MRSGIRDHPPIVGGDPGDVTPRVLALHRAGIQVMRYQFHLFLPLPWWAV
jgi:hypothetical protein